MKYLNNIFRIFTVSAVLFLAASCDEGGDPTIKSTSTKDFAGDWHIKIYNPDGSQAEDYSLYSTYNASANDNSFWIDDHDHAYQLKSKVFATDFNFLTFTGKANSPELYNGGAVTVSKGKILKNLGKSFGGHRVDSIYFEAEFDWDPGVVYKFGGHKRTGFLEDELH